MTPLTERLLAQITQTGPMSVAAFMQTCLLDPTHGYYTTRDPLGAQGDFTTAPEISQMFGEVLGLCVAQTWMDQGAPTSFALVELGPGRGTLMADILRATKAVAGFAPAVHLVEASPSLRAEQAKRLAGYEPVWHDQIDTLPMDQPLYLVANEFFDALPIRQFQKTKSGWAEIVIAHKNQSLTFGRLPAGVPSFLATRMDVGEGQIVEHCPSLPVIVAQISRRMADQGGAALFIDYGDWRSLGDTLQALRGHQPEPPLANPGEADLTAHVDFEAIAQAATGVTPSAMIPQGLLLERLGITARAQALAGKLNGAALESHIKAHRRLTHPEEMGNLFKAIALVPFGANLPPGFDPC